MRSCVVLCCSEGASEGVIVAKTATPERNRKLLVAAMLSWVIDLHFRCGKNK